MSKFLFILLQIDIPKKLKEAPDDNYQIGIIIGTYLPLAVLFAFAYYFYHKAKKKNDFDDN
jgi:hypothetical protein